jgi:hypothetical protein
MLFAMSTTAPLFNPPEHPQAVTVEVLRINTDEVVDRYSDMFDPNWINKDQNF